MLHKISQDQFVHYNQENMQVKILYPGKILAKEDSGLGTLARFDHAILYPGASIAMHAHHNDEIITYVRSGTLSHKDNMGNSIALSKNQLMVMNTGKKLMHEESVSLKDERVEMLQVFFRPTEKNLNPEVQTCVLKEAFSLNQWRLLASGKESKAPLGIRSSSWFFDNRLEKGKVTEFPILLNTENLSFLLYNFKGNLIINKNIQVSEGESLYAKNQKVMLKATEETEMVLFVTDEKSTFTENGMFSANKMKMGKDIQQIQD